MLIFCLWGAFVTTALCPETQVGRALGHWLVVRPAQVLNATTPLRLIGWIALLVFLLLVSRAAPSELSSVLSLDYAMVFEIATASILASGVLRLRILSDAASAIMRRCLAGVIKTRAAMPRARTPRLKPSRRVPPAIEDEPAWAFA